MTARILLYFISVLTAGVAQAFPMEGFEPTFLIGRGKPGTSATLAIDRVDSVWLEEKYQSARIQTTVPVTDSFLLNAGFKGESSPNPWAHSAGYLKSDWKFAESSLVSLKYTYHAWNLLPASRDIFTLEYSAFFPYSKLSGVYLCLGYFHRWLRQSWDSDWARPLNLQTEDNQGFFSLLIGWQWEFGNQNYWTIDINNRDAFDHHNLDHAAFDLTINWSVADTVYVGLLGGIRTSSTFMGTVYPAQYQVGIGLTYY